MTDLRKLPFSVPPASRITDALVPPLVRIPLYISLGAVRETGIPAGTIVSEGEVLVRGGENGIPVRSSVPGVITEYIEGVLPDGGRTAFAVIKTQGAFTYFGRSRKKRLDGALSAQELCAKLLDGGVMDTFGHPAPLGKLVESFVAETAEGDTVGGRGGETKKTAIVARFFDEDPLSITGEAIANFYFDDVIDGLALLAETLAVPDVFVLYPGKSPLRVKLAEAGKDRGLCCVPVRTSRYPAGKKENFAPFIKKAGFDITTAKVLYTDSFALLGTARAVLYGIPVLERLVQVSGGALPLEKLFRVRIGTPVSALVEECGGFKKPPAKIVINGMVTGKASGDHSIPVTVDMASVFLPDRETLGSQEPECCVRCGRCRAVCPRGIHPDKLFQAYTYGMEVSGAVQKSVSLCNICYACNTVCPSRLPLAQTIGLLQEASA